jgi:prevent-host-death family protein
MLVYYWTMIKLNVHEAKTHLSEYLAKLEQGDPIVLRKRNRPIAGIRPIPALSDAPRPMVSRMISSSTGELLRTVAAIDNRGLRRRPARPSLKAS